MIMGETLQADRSRLPVAISPGPDPDLITTNRLDKFIEGFLAEQSVCDGTLRGYRTGLRRFLSHLRENGTTQPERSTLVHYVRSMTEQGLSASYVGLNLVVCRRFFEWLESKRLYPNVAKGVRGPRPPRGFKKDALTRDQVLTLLSATTVLYKRGGRWVRSQIDPESVRGKRDRALLNLLVRCGLRSCEVVRASVGDLRQTGSEGRLYIHGKGRSSADEWAFLTPETLQPLREYLSTRPDASDDEPLFASLAKLNNGRRLSTRSIRGIVRSYFLALGWDSHRMSCHSLRHSCITGALLGGAKIQEARVLARHSSIDTTLRYSHDIDRAAKPPERFVAAWLDAPETENEGSSE